MNTDGGRQGLYMGVDFGHLLRSQERLPIYWSPARLSNCHIGISGISGSGKTHQIRQFISSLPGNVCVEIFDYHEDIEIDLPGTKTLLFSPQTKYGYNPLVINPDPHYGGCYRAVSDVQAALKASSKSIGDLQLGLIGSLIMDLYASRGIDPDDPGTWIKKIGTAATLDALREAGDEQALYHYYPTLRDLYALTRRHLQALYQDIDDRDDGKAAIDSHNDFVRAQKSFYRAQDAASRAEEDGASNKRYASVLEKRDELRTAAIDRYSEYLDSIRTGRELDEIIKYSNRDRLESVYNRLKGLIDIGLFEPNPPPWGDARIRRYVLRPLASSQAELTMFVRFRLQAIVREMMEAGNTDGRLRRVVVLDEAKIFNSEDMDNPINIISTQMRKFGLGIMQASQSPTHFSDDFLKNAGTLVLLNLATADWDEAARRLKIKVGILKHLKSREVAAIRMIENGGNTTFKGLYLK